MSFILIIPQTPAVSFLKNKMDVYDYGNTSADIILLQPVDEHDLNTLDNEISCIRENTDADFGLLAFGIDDWNRELSPWEAPAVFGKNDFGAGAEDTLREILKYCDTSKTCIIGGYSLAGLFALWSAYRTEVFSAVAAASPSVWFPGFYDLMEKSTIRTGNVYLSLGDREEKAKNPVMATVGDRIRAAHALLSDRGVNCCLEWNAGNHFRDADIRTAKAFSWAIRNADKTV